MGCCRWGVWVSDSQGLFFWCILVLKKCGFLTKFLVVQFGLINF